MAFLGSGKVDGEIELSNKLRQRRYPRGKVAIRHIEEFFENRLKTMYKDAPPKWKKEYAKEVFGRIAKYKKLVFGRK